MSKLKRAQRGYISFPDSFTISVLVGLAAFGIAVLIAAAGYGIYWLFTHIAIV